MTCLLFGLPASAIDKNMTPLSLEDALSIAIKNNSRIKEATQNQKSAYYEMKSAKADMFMKASAAYSYTRLGEKPVLKMDPSEMSPIPAPSSRKAIQVADKNQFHWDITLVQPLFTGFALRTRLDMTTLNMEIKQQEKIQAILDLKEQVKTAYFNALFTKKILNVADDAVSCLKSHEKDAQKLYDHGMIRLNDLLSARVACANVIQDRERAIMGVQMTLSELNMLMAVDINRKTEIKDIEDTIFKNYYLEDLTNQAMKERPVFKVLNLGIQTLGKASTLTKSSFYPSVALIGCYERDGDNPEASDNDYSNDEMSSLTVQADWTFFEWGKTRSDISKLKHEKRALLEKIKVIEDGIKMEVKEAFLSLDVARKNIETAKKSLGQAKENWRITNLQYNQQVSTSSEVLDARTYLTEADTNYYEALYGYMIALSRLERSIGKQIT